MKHIESFQEQEKTGEITNQKILFGQVKLGARVPGGFQGFLKQYKNEKIDWAGEFEKVKELQPEDVAAFADELHTVVCEKLGVTDPEQLQFYTAIGSTIDYGLGVDGFMELYLENGEAIRVTLDGTFNLYKVEQGKPTGKPEADVIFAWPEESQRENSIQWNQLIQEAAAMIDAEFRRKAAELVAHRSKPKSR